KHNRRRHISQPPCGDTSPHSKSCAGRNGAQPRGYNHLSILSKSLERDRRQVFAEFLSFPPRARFSMLVAGCESVSIQSGPNVSRRFLRKRIARKESCHIRFAFEQTNFEVVEPQIFSRRPQRCERHLPI